MKDVSYRSLTGYKNFDQDFVFELDRQLKNINRVLEFLQIYTGKGSPEDQVKARVGSLFLRLDGDTSTTLYVKETGDGKTGWVAK